MSDLIPSEPTDPPIPDNLKPPVSTDMSDDVRKKRMEQNKKLVAELLIKNITSAEDIQHVLKKQFKQDVAIRTIYRYKKEITEENLKKMEEEGVGKTIEQLSYELKQSYEMIIKELWIQYHQKEQSGSVRVKALAEIRNTSDKFREMLQSMGLVKKAPEQHQFLDANGNPVDPTFMQNREMLNQEFTAWIKAKYQTPVGIIEPTPPVAPATSN